MPTVMLEFCYQEGHSQWDGGNNYVSSFEQHEFSIDKLKVGQNG